jgi:hypothetical protein
MGGVVRSAGTQMIDRAIQELPFRNEFDRAGRKLD